MKTPQAGLYIHVPFCRKRCPFCDFAITTELDDLGAWLSALEAEMALRSGSWQLPFDTVYFGGGTPSLLEAGMVERILRGARACFQVEDRAEVTLEANPGTLRRGDYASLLEIGVNRLILGVQSFDDGDLTFLGRDHRASECEESLRFAREEGFENLSLDLIYGLPRSTTESWGRQVERALEWRPEHISAYMLTYEPGTPLTRQRDRGEFEELSEAQAEELFLFTRERLGEAGYHHYEVSSFARASGFESRHNRKYWEGAPYLGLGPSAHSYRDPERSWNTPRTRGYLEALAAGRDPEAGRETLGPEERSLERLALGLRTARGLDLASYEEEFGEDLRASRGPELENLRRGGLLVLEGGVLRLTPRGLAVADAVALRLSGER